MSVSQMPWMIEFDLVHDLIGSGVSRVIFSRSTKRDEIITEAGTKYLSMAAKDDMSLDDRRRLARRIVNMAKKSGIKHLAVSMRDCDEYFGQLADVLVEFAKANYEHVRFKTEPKDGWDFVKRITLVTDTGVLSEIQINAAIEYATIMAQGLGMARDLSNAPANEVNPIEFIRRVKLSPIPEHVDIHYLNEGNMSDYGLNGMLAVSRGSVHKPRMLIAQYRGADEKPIMLCGKGVTFDDGGCDHKTDPSDMHMDKSGAAAVVAAVFTAARLGLKKHVVALIPLVENRLSGDSYRTNDIITIAGKTVQIGNTDAEGRLILADAIGYGKDAYDPRCVITVATLTGAVRTAVGNGYSGLFVHNTEAGKVLACQLIDIGQLTGEKLWRLPLDSDHAAEIKSLHADLCNVGKYRAVGGASTAAAFLEVFVGKDLSWAHIDMASRMKSCEHDQLADGAPGDPMCTLVKIIESL